VVKEPVKVIAQPLGDRVIVRRIQEQQKGLIIIPGAKRENSDMGKVVAVGPGRFGEAMTVVVGDEVLFPKNGVMEIEIDEEAMVMMRESDIHAIL
jgi:chaperonin GroES